MAGFSASVIFLMAIWTVDASKIVIMSMPGGGHLTEAGNIGQDLVKIGHEVHVLMSNLVQNPSRLEGRGMKLLHYKSIENPGSGSIPQSLEHTSKPNIEAFLIERAVWNVDCNNVVNNQSMIRIFKEEKYDLAIVDGIMVCYYVLPHNLDIPYITYTSLLYTKNFKLNPLIYALPCDVQANPNTFLNRYKHIYQTVWEYEMISDWLIDETLFLNATAERPYSSLGELQGKSALILYNQNPILDCPIPVLPNMLIIGGVGAKPPKPLSGEYLNIYDNAKKGVIVVSFGSFVSDMPDNSLNKFLNVFRKLDQQIVWRLNTRKDSKIKVFPDNVYISPWLPQNDLLGDKRTKLFITHGGNNGQTEGLYNGVPMLTMPLFGDQHYNARRSEFKNWGQSLHILHFTETELENTIKELITNSKYKNGIEKSSKLFKYFINKEELHKKIVTVIEELLKFGSAHTITNIQKLGFCDAQQWDFLILIFVLITVMIICFLFIIISFCGKKNKTKCE